MTEKFCQDWGQGPHKLKLGKSFEPKKGGGAPVYNSIRYDFKPTSIDQEGLGTLEVKDGRSVAVSLPHSDGVGQTTYKGNTEPAPPKDCVLIIDHETGELTLERVTNNIRVKKTRPEKREGGASSAVGSSEPTSNPYEVKANPANPYEVKPNPANPYEVKSNPTNPRAPDRQQRISNSGGARPVTPQAKKASPKHPTTTHHLADSLSPINSNKSSPASTSGRGPSSQGYNVDSLGRPLSSESSSESSDSDSDDPDDPPPPKPSKSSKNNQSAPALPSVTSAPASVNQAGGPSMPGDLEDLLGGLPSSRPSNSSKPRVSGGRPPPPPPSQPSLPVSAAPPPRPTSAQPSMPAIFLGDDLELSDDSE